MNKQAFAFALAFMSAVAIAKSPAATPLPSAAPTSRPTAASEHIASFRPPKGWMQTGQLVWTSFSNGMQAMRIAKSGKTPALEAADPTPGVKAAFAAIAGAGADVEVTTVCDGKQKAYRTTAHEYGGPSGPAIEETMVIGTSSLALLTYSRGAGKPVDPVARAAINSLCWP